ncbi:MAG: Protein GrpE [Xanthomonadales bacterium]|nr:Protein GrpE [Xanthomonadales bacterium]
MHESQEQERAESGIEAEGFGPADSTEALHQRIIELEAELLRERAETENQRKRWLREFEQARKFGVDRLLNDLLPVIDSLEQGLKAAEAPGTSADSLRQGTEMTLRLLLKAADGHGLGVVDPQGQAFNPELHQAMGVQPSTEVPSDHVLLVLQKGYRLHDRLVRPALVMVSQG